MIVATYNIQHGNTGGQVDLPRVAGIIKGLGADLVAIQEIDYKTNRTKKVDQTKELATRAGYPYYFFGKAMNYDDGQYGNSILSKHPFTNPQVVPIVKVPGTLYAEPHALVVVDLNINSKQLRFCSVHFGFDAAQMVAVGAVGKVAQWAGNTVIGGDFNCIPGQIPFQAMANWFKPVGNKIDNFLYRGAVAMTDYKEVPDGTPDHSPFTARMEWI